MRTDHFCVTWPSLVSVYYVPMKLLLWIKIYEQVYFILLVVHPINNGKLILVLVMLYTKLVSKLKKNPYQFFIFGLFKDISITLGL